MAGGMEQFPPAIAPANQSSGVSCETGGTRSAIAFLRAGRQAYSKAKYALLSRN